MRATTYSEIFDFQTAIESGSYQLLSGLGFSNVYTSRGTDVMTTPRVEVTFTLGSPTGRMTVAPDGLPLYSAFSGRITVTVITSRELNQSHASYQSQVLALFRHQNIFNSGSLLNFHECQDLVLAGVSPTIDSDSGLDMSAIAYSAKFAVLPNAWPTGSV